MAEEDTYIIASLVADDELQVRSVPSHQVFAKYLEANWSISTALITGGFGLVVFSAIADFNQAVITWFDCDVPLPALFLVGWSFLLAGMLQRKHNLAAMAFSSTLSLAILIGLLALLRSCYRELKLDWNTDPRRWMVMVLTVGLWYSSFTWALTGPLRLMMQARHWRRCGIDLAALEQKTAVPGDIAAYLSLARWRKWLSKKTPTDRHP